MRFLSGTRPARKAVLVITLEDVTLADAPSTTVATARSDLATPVGDGSGFVLEYPEPLDPRRRYALRAHVDGGGTGSVTVGDFVSTTANPVGPATEQVEIEVREVG